MNASGQPVDPLLVVRWIPEFLRVRTATGDSAPAGGEPAKGAEEDAGGARDAEGTPEVEAREESKEAEGGRAKEPDLGRIRGLQLPRNASKPLLVFFHWPHEDGDRGRRIMKFCNGPIDDESFVRVSPLFHCIEVNTRDSEARLVEEARVRSTPAMAVCRLDGTVVWRADEGGTSGRALAETLKRVLREKFTGTWEAVEKETAGQKAVLSAARRLLASGKSREAMESLVPVVDSDVRFTETWAEGVRLFRGIEKKVVEEEEKGSK